MLQFWRTMRIYCFSGAHWFWYIVIQHYCFLHLYDSSLCSAVVVTLQNKTAGFFPEWVCLLWWKTHQQIVVCFPIWDEFLENKISKLASKIGMILYIINGYIFYSFHYIVHLDIKYGLGNTYSLHRCFPAQLFDQYPLLLKIWELKIQIQWLYTRTYIGT